MDHRTCCAKFPNALRVFHTHIYFVHNFTMFSNIGHLKKHLIFSENLQTAKYIPQKLLALVQKPNYQKPTVFEHWFSNIKTTPPKSLKTHQFFFYIWRTRHGHTNVIFSLVSKTCYFAKEVSAFMKHADPSLNRPIKR